MYKAGKSILHPSFQNLSFIFRPHVFIRSLPFSLPFLAVFGELSWFGVTIPWETLVPLCFLPETQEISLTHDVTLCHFRYNFLLIFKWRLPQKRSSSLLPVCFQPFFFFLQENRGGKLREDGALNFVVSVTAYILYNVCVCVCVKCCFKPPTEEKVPFQFKSSW